VRKPREIGEGEQRYQTSVGCATEKSIVPNLNLGLSHAPDILGRPSQPRAHLTVGGARASGSAAAPPSPRSQPGAGSSAKPSQPNNSASALVKTPSHHRPLVDRQRHFRPTTTNPSPRSSPSPMDPMSERQPQSRRRCRPMAQRRSSSLRRALRSSRPHVPI